jgi:hypothetical protein
VIATRPLPISIRFTGGLGGPPTCEGLVMVDNPGSGSPQSGVKKPARAAGSADTEVDAVSEFDVAALRKRAWQLGSYRLLRAGDEFRLLDGDRDIATGCFDAVAGRLNGIETERAETGDPITVLRKELRAAGYAPVPALGKQVLLPEWPTKHQVDDAELDRWRRGKWAAHSNTGLLTRTTPALDVDIRNPAAAAAVEQFLRARFEGQGKVLRRVGLAPKFAMPFRTDEPFDKITGRLEEDPKGDKLEFLGDASSSSSPASIRIPRRPIRGSAVRPARPRAQTYRRSRAKRRGCSSLSCRGW